MSVDYSKAIKLAKLIKENKILKKSIIIVGGVHISTLPDSLNENIDIGVIGEGEETLTEIISFFEKNNYKLDKKGLKDIKGLVFHNKDKLIKTDTRELIKNLDDIPLPHPDYAKLNVSPKESFFFKKKKQAMMLTSRGCPYRCVFCSTSKFWGFRIRFVSAKRVADEIMMWYNNYGVTDIVIWDDLFTVNAKRLKDIAEILKEKKIIGKIEFGVCCRSNTLTEEVCKVLKELNVTGLNFGFESGSPRILDYLKKGSVTVEEHKRAILLARKYKLKVSGSFIFGSPKERIKDMKKTLQFMDWCKKNKVYHLWSLIMTPFPGTEIWEIAKKKGVVSDNMDWEKLSLMGDTQKHSLVMDSKVDKEEFYKVFKKSREMFMSSIFKMWAKRLLKSPIPTLKLVFSNGRIKRFLKKDFI